MRILYATFFALLMVTGTVKAQVIDDTSIQDAQSGGYSFVEGMFVAYLADTVSPGYAREQFKRLEISILDEFIKPMIISIVNSPSRESVEKLRNHSKVRAFYTAVQKGTFAEIEAFLEQSSFSEAQKEEIRQQAEQRETYFVELDYSINEKALKEMMGEFRDVAYKIMSNQPRSVTLKAKPGNEPLLMDKVNSLNFVESTAMISTIGN